MMQMFFGFLLNFFSSPNHLQKKPPKTNWMAVYLYLLNLNLKPICGLAIHSNLILLGNDFWIVSGVCTLITFLNHNFLINE